MARRPGFAHKFRRDEGGATMLEYALLIALVAVVSIVAVRALGTSLVSPFQHVITGLS